MTPQQAAFLDALVEFLTTGEAAQSIHLELQLPSAVAWAKLRATTPLFGYHSTPEDIARARAQLLELFGWRERRTPPWVPGPAPSKWCANADSEAAHGWCANRNPSETHCTCSCHK